MVNTLMFWVNLGYYCYLFTVEVILFTVSFSADQSVASTVVIQSAFSEQTSLSFDVWNHLNTELDCFVERGTRSERLRNCWLMSQPLQEIQTATTLGLILIRPSRFARVICSCEVEGGE